MASNYWSRFTQGRVSRRNALKITGAGAFSAAFLAACGSDDATTPSPTTPPATGPTGPATGPTGPTGATGPTGPEEHPILSRREDQSEQAVLGGTLITTNPADPPQFDPHLLSLPAAMPISLAYNKLLALIPGVLQPPDGSIQADMAEAWELSADNLTLTLKIRQDAGTPDTGPTNGRTLDASDVLFAWNRWAETGSNRQDLVNAVNPAAPVLSVEATDSHTIVMTLKEPTAPILASLSPPTQGQFFVMPKEADGGFDPRNTMAGAGPYYMSEYVPSARLEYTRNPNTYDKRAYPEKIQQFIIPETAQVVAQLIGGNIHLHYTALSPDSVLQVKQDQDRIAMYQGFLAPVGVTTFFGTKVGSAFLDERVRQAYSMAIDRDLFLDAFANVSRFEAEGLPVETAWNAALGPSDYAGWWLDPQGPDFGPNAKFFQHDIAEAKQLLAAAGHPNGLRVQGHEAAGGNYGPLYSPQIEVVQGMAHEAGIDFDRTDYQIAEWNSDYRDSHGWFDGIAFRLTPVPGEPRNGSFALYNTAGSLNYGFDPTGNGYATKDDVTGDPYLDEITTKMRAEFDTDKAIALAHEMQQYIGGKQYFVRAFASAAGFQVAWPAVRNYSVFQGTAWGELFKQYWLDTSRAPFV